jgi:ABC-type nitrate/sulfonate/bicarbonate transport system permease component
MAIGIAIGIAMGRQPRLDRFFDGWLVLFLNIPRAGDDRTVLCLVPA